MKLAHFGYNLSFPVAVGPVANSILLVHSLLVSSLRCNNYAI